MTATEVYDVLHNAFPDAIESGPNGVALVDEKGIVFRLECGSGIAGRGGIWAITFPGTPEVDPICGIATQKQLRQALRRMILDMVTFGRVVAGKGGQP